MNTGISQRINRNWNALKSQDQLSRTLGYYVAFMTLGLVAASLGPTLPGLAENTHTLLNEIGFLFTARSLGYLLGSFLGGRVYDRVSGHPVMAAMLVAMAVLMALVPLIPLLWLLTAVLLLLGIAEGTLDVGGNTLLVWTHRGQVGPFMNGLHFFFGIGAFVSPIIIAQAVLASGGIAWAYWTLALLILPMSLWLLRLPSPKARTVPQEGNTTSPPRPRQSRPPDERLLIILIAFFLFLYVGAEIGFGGWIFTYAVTLDLSSETVAAYLTSAFWGSFTLGRLLSIPIATRFRPGAVLLSDLAGCLVSGSVILLWPSSLAAVWLGTFGLGFSMAAIFPTTLSLAERRMTITGRVTGWFFVGASAGGMSLPWLIGQLFESLGPHALTSAVLIDLILALGTLAVLMLYSARFSETQQMQIGLPKSHSDRK